MMQWHYFSKTAARSQVRILGKYLVQERTKHQDMYMYSLGVRHADWILCGVDITARSTSRSGLAVAEHVECVAAAETTTV